MKLQEDFFDIEFGKGPFGYRTDDVDEFVTRAIDIIKVQQEEIQVLQDKLGVLAAGLEKYREDEDSLRSALIGAQKLGDNILKDSKSKAEVILRDATVQANHIIEEAHTRLVQEQEEYLRVKEEVHRFRESLIAIYKGHIDQIGKIPQRESKKEQAQLTMEPEKPEEPAAVWDAVPEAAEPTPPTPPPIQEPVPEPERIEVPRATWTPEPETIYNPRQESVYQEPAEEIPEPEFEPEIEPEIEPEPEPEPIYRRRREPAYQAAIEEPEEEVRIYEEPAPTPVDDVRIYGAPAPDPAEDVLMYREPAVPPVSDYAPAEAVAEFPQETTGELKLALVEDDDEEFEDSPLVSEFSSRIDQIISKGSGEGIVYTSAESDMDDFDDDEPEDIPVTRSPVSRSPVYSPRFGVLKFGDDFDLMNDEDDDTVDPASGDRK